MEQSSIQFAELFKSSFQKYQRYASFVVGVMATYFVLAIVPQIYYMLQPPSDPTTRSQLLSILLTFVQLFLSLGFIKVMLLLIDDAYVEVTDLFNNGKLFLSYFVAYFLYTIAVVIGFFLLVLPGIFIAVRFQFYPYFILEEQESSFTALKNSYYLTQDLTLELFLFGLAVIVLNMLGALLFGIGVIFTYPLTTMATAIIYKSLRKEAAIIPADPYRPKW